MGNAPAPATSGTVYASVDNGPWMEIGYTADGVPSAASPMWRHRFLDDEDYLEHVYGGGCALNDNDVAADPMSVRSPDES